MAPKKTNLKTCSAPSIKAGRRYIDNWSHYLSLSDSNLDVISLVDTLEIVRRKWYDSQTENTTLQERIAQLELQNSALTSENSEVKNRLLHCQNELAALVNTTRNQKNEISEWRKKFELVRSAMKDDTAAAHELGKIFKDNNNTRNFSDMSHSNTTGSTSYANNYNNVRLRSRLEPILDEDKENSISETSETSDIDYDKTAESLDEMYDHVSFRRGSKRRSASVAPNVKFSPDAPPDVVEPFEKKPRNELTTQTTIKIDMSGQTKPTATVRISGKLNRSSSENDIRARLRPTVPRGGAVASSSTDLRSPNPSWTNGKPIELRTHRVTSVRPLTGSCVVCHKYFVGTTALKCVLCQIEFHKQCQHKTPMPCIPKVDTPKPGSKNRATLKQYCPQTHPMVPPILIRCVLHLEKMQFIALEGIYRIPGSQSEVDKLYHDLLTNKPNAILTAQSDVITSCIKKFLKELRDSLLPATSYEDFIRAIEPGKPQQALIDCVLDLPAPNRDTLAFFMRHLQKVATFEQTNKMPLTNLARVLAPSIVGYYNVVKPTINGSDHIVRNQHQILRELLNLPAEFWDRIIMCNMSAILAEEARSPGSQSQYLTLTPSRAVPSRKVFGTPRNNNLMDTPKSIFSSRQDNAADSSPLIQPLTSLSGRRNNVGLSNLC